MLHKETVTNQLLEVIKALMLMEELSQFQLVGGTAIALQLGHRKSIDIDLFSNESVNLKAVAQAIKNSYPDTPPVTLTGHSVGAVIKGVKVDIYDDWSIPFQAPPLIEEGIRLAALEDLAAFKLSAIIGRREKKDYIDLFFLFKRLSANKVLNDFKTYEPLLSARSLLFALSEVDTARENRTPMPNMMMEFNWVDAKKVMRQAAKDYIGIVNKERGR